MDDPAALLTVTEAVMYLPAQMAEGLLCELLSEELPEDPEPHGVLGDILACFDLGVRYQQARVNPGLLEVEEPSWELED